MFVDRAKITIKAGDGGDGCVSFHREKFVVAGGPDGGDGGKGGDVIFKVETGMRTLMDFRYKHVFKAESGAPGSSRNRTGKNGADIVIRVPQGTLVREAGTDKIIADMHSRDAEKTVIRGGRGGKGNAKFATPTRQAPGFAQPGQKRRSAEVILELKSIADVGLVGYPNVGKSTILSVITSARPKIAAYHFTTLSPNLGIVRHKSQTFAVADIPGLIEGASKGVGLGHDFLRHIERTRVLVHVVDVSGSEGRDPIEDYRNINRELSEYSAELAARPMIVAANKSDIASPEDIERLREALEPEVKVFTVSAATALGFDDLLSEVSKMLAELPEQQPFEEDEFWYIEAEDAYEILKEDGVYHVKGTLADKILERTFPDDPDSMRYFHRALEKSGIISALREAGIKDGDAVEIGGVEFDFID
ncbi:MAG: GTPase ObgE [Christensenellales bacterium]|jgi:GTP-binding protein